MSKALADIPVPIPVLDLFSLAGKAIIVTGGARGLGLCIAQSLPEASAAHVYCCDVLSQPHAEEWAQAKQVAQRYGGEIEYLQVDITDAGMVDDVVGRIYEQSEEEVCGLFAAAGIQQMTAALDYTPEDFRRIMDVNVTGTVLPVLSVALRELTRVYVRLCRDMVHHPSGRETDAETKDRRQYRHRGEYVGNDCEQGYVPTIL